VDSKFALALAKNLVFHERSKHIRIKYHFIWGCLKEGSLKASYIRTEDQLADILTKSLARVKFHELRARIGLVHNTVKTHPRLRGRMMDKLVCVYVRWLPSLVFLFA
jgi:hypothetical protein